MSVRLLLFINVNSGGGLGQTLADHLVSDSTIKIIRLPKEFNEFKKLNKSILYNKNLKVAIAGGDGSANWIVPELAKFYGYNSTSFRPPVAIIPLGTGNDLSRTLNWGSSFNMIDFLDLGERIKAIKNGEIVKNIDLWNVNVNETGNIVKDYPMINYFSLGVDANIANDFAETRMNYPMLFFSQVFSKLMYVPLTLFSLFGQPFLHQFLSGSMIMKNNKLKKLRFRDESKTFVVQNIPYIYGGADLVKDKKHRFVDDGNFEVITQGGALSLGASHIGINLGKQLGQAHQLNLHSNKEMCYQVDGEAFKTKGPTSFKVERLRNYPFLYAPEHTGPFFGL
ncbi:hypothetical protein TVAG_215120 [Trichomonas vaginalis G3]|uniref:Diacylglycerol kinase n=1 Tax=Trichomonas vaginalis (strain ATCC PRA-98 / G3) TaxID=412133 RepID=A2F642_TRIV3|nr:protein kinase C-activating G-protein coupled receptor signaling pathway [Trichomonas vaginalis G3]EAX99612.1 hypothetical protein TVAG_215120 [Trichomonas vaginalis G3]KAI5532128.1 protein kinase C-activating G-protein coupled receptor signaling pathway [Trichomonas vaginalis G3]|eukprot:XP_001312542.1 hypothetical protein [Trichomonas vaginalis G3]